MWDVAERRIANVAGNAAPRTPGLTDSPLEGTPSVRLCNGARITMKARTGARQTFRRSLNNPVRHSKYKAAPTRLLSASADGQRAILLQGFHNPGAFRRGGRGSAQRLGHNVDRPTDGGVFLPSPRKL